MKPPALPRLRREAATPVAPVSEEQLRLQLLALIDSGGLRGSALFQAGKVLTRLGTPARVILVGSADRIKLDLISLLLGEDLDLPSPPQPLLLTSAAAQASLSAGSQKSRPVEVVANPAPNLATMSLLLLPAARSREDHREDLTWAAEQCDICIWASLGFDSTEAALWSHAPLPLRTNAFLAAPQIGAPPPGFLARFDPQAELGKLAAALLERAALARQARRDQAALFVARYGASARPAKARPSRNWQIAPIKAKTAPGRTKT